MGKIIVKSEKMPVPTAPLSQGTKAGDFVYVSGAVAIDPKTGRVVAGGIKEQTKQVMENVRTVLEAAGASLKDVVKTTVFLKDMRDFASMNEVYRTYFPTDPPARSALEAKLASPDFIVEVEAVAYLGP